ncbi:MAG TPA: carboxymuconolactone decarboxylase family protein [Hanamia sp.]|nr:carboxymuconolactone decarboxylase family protein [Hanamia sp.]
MTRFKVPGKEEVSGKNKEIFNRLQETLGAVPNLYAVMAYSHNALSKYLTFQNSPSSLNIKEKEVINLVVSQVNRSGYGLSAHTLIAKMNDLSDEEISKIRRGNASDPELDALVVFAKAVTETQGNVTEKVLHTFFEAGYTKENLVDAILQICDEIAGNYLYNITQVPIDFPIASKLKQ